MYNLDFALLIHAQRSSNAARLYVKSLTTISELTYVEIDRLIDVPETCILRDGCPMQLSLSVHVIEVPNPSHSVGKFGPV